MVSPNSFNNSSTYNLINARSKKNTVSIALKTIEHILWNSNKYNWILVNKPQSPFEFRWKLNLYGNYHRDSLKNTYIFPPFYIIFGVNKEGKMQKMVTPSVTDHAKFGSQAIIIWKNLHIFLFWAIHLNSRKCKILERLNAPQKKCRFGFAYLGYPWSREYSKKLQIFFHTNWNLFSIKIYPKL